MATHSVEGHFGHQTASGHLTVPPESKEPYAADVLAQLHADAEQVVARYPQKRSALLPLLHLVQSVDGYITGRGIDFCAEVLDLTRAEVSGVATFYTQYKRHPNGEYTVGVCTNTLCAIMGGDQIWESVSEHLGIGHDETTPDGKITLERVECNAACDYAPTRGPSRVCSFKEVSRVLAGFHDGLADEGVGAGPASLQGLNVARQHNWTAPAGAEQVSGEHRAEATSGAMAAGRHTSQDTPANQPDELPGGKDGKDTEGEQK